MIIQYFPGGREFVSHIFEEKKSSRHLDGQSGKTKKYESHSHTVQIGNLLYV